MSAVIFGVTIPGIPFAAAGGKSANNFCGVEVLITLVAITYSFLSVVPVAVTSGFKKPPPNVATAPAT